ncbi:hypothetical protein H6P81_020207 [Aristolochia fimbriata]|uniref:Transmembrane protein n=1 Tax=Aristolochia fimbriata TaxID=158543 RepID=A0AAV7DX19_ARIFI|nr:hypothetical protein H6P81_020207 [Aristolochia fimbriata]
MESNAEGEEPKPLMSWKEKFEGQWRKTKEHAETYPYVWASYIVVYGGLAVYTTYRWRKLRKTEDRVRVLQARLRKLVEAEESSVKVTSSQGFPSAQSSVDEASK